ncbi:MAG: hypothetical protein FJ271_02685 [Planctomycetes bacterium]|nr:hypothetical protein [Planctomycetota bacterium]
MSHATNLSRRKFLASSGIGLTAALQGQASRQQPRGRVKVAAIYTVFHHRSHAHVILEKFLRPYFFNGKRIQPPVEVVSFYADQRLAEGDMTQDVSRQFKVPVYKTIADALTLGGKELAVDAVLSIGEHGSYRTNKLGQVEYPRKRFFDEITAVMRRSRRFVPLFNDKHLSYRWDWAREMYDTSRKLGIPLMAGSSVPLAQRRPALALPADAAVEEAVSIHGGGLESYDFHGLEVLQSIVEARKGGEQGVSGVEFLTGDALWRAAQQGRWSRQLAEAAMAAEFGDRKVPDLSRPIPGEKPEPAHGLLLTYRDGFKATVLKIGRSAVRWNFACKLAGDKRLHATSYYVGPWGNRCLFMALSHAIQDHFVQRRSPYPVERTLLTTGVLEAVMRSRQEGRRIATPHLNFAYQPRDFTAFREMGASWKTLEGVAEPRGINPIGDR